MRKLAFSVGVLLLFAAPAAAQDYPKGEFFGGFSVANSADGSPEQFYGFETSVTGNFNRSFGITGDFAGQFKSTSILGVNVNGQVYQYLIGPRGAVRGDRVTGFVHALFGGLTVRASGGGASFSETGLAIALGGGLDVNAGKRVAIRVFQLDYLPNRLAGVWSKKDFRASAGVVFKWGEP